MIKRLEEQVINKHKELEMIYEKLDIAREIEELKLRVNTLDSDYFKTEDEQVKEFILDITEDVIFKIGDLERELEKLGGIN